MLILTYTNSVAMKHGPSYAMSNSFMNSSQAYKIIWISSKNNLNSSSKLNLNFSKKCDNVSFSKEI